MYVWCVKRTFHVKVSTSTFIHQQRSLTLSIAAVLRVVGVCESIVRRHSTIPKWMIQGLGLKWGCRHTVVVFYWPLGSKQYQSQFTYTWHTPTHDKEHTSAHWSHEINIASLFIMFIRCTSFPKQMLLHIYGQAQDCSNSTYWWWSSMF